MKVFTQMHILQISIQNSTMCQAICHLPILTQTWVRKIINIYQMVPEMAILMLGHSYQRNSQMVPIHLALPYLWIVILHLYYYQLLLLKMIAQIMNGHPDGVGTGAGRLENDLLPLDSELLLL